MIKKNVTGDEALVWGALKNSTGYIAGHTAIFSHPAMELIQNNSIRIHTCLDGKICIEQAIGASFVKIRSVLYLKNPEFYQCLYSLHLASLHEIHAGIIVIVQDDPGAWNSQTEQDVRSMAMAQYLPIFEPAHPQEGYDLIAEAYRVSETFCLPVVIRITTSYVLMKSNIDVQESLLHVDNAETNEKKWLSNSSVAVENRNKLIEKSGKIEFVLNKSRFNQVVGSGASYVIVSGQVFSKLSEVIGSNMEKEFTILKISCLFPPPITKIKNILEDAEKVLVLEETESYIETVVRETAQNNSLSLPIWGRETGHVLKSGELFKWQIEDILTKFKPGFTSAGFFFPYQEKKSREEEATLCFGCSYYSIFSDLKDVCDTYPKGEGPVFIGDPGCPSRLAEPPYEMVQIVNSPGSAIGIACGIALFEKDRRVVAVTDDVSFFQSGLNSLIEAGFNFANIVVLILDTSYVRIEKAGKRGGSEHEVLADISIEELILSCHVNYHKVIEESQFPMIKSVFRRAIENRGLSVIVIKNVCSLIS